MIQRIDNELPAPHNNIEAWPSGSLIITLAAVVSGLGIVLWLTALAEYLKRKDSLYVWHYWVLPVVFVAVYAMQLGGTTS